MAPQAAYRPASTWRPAAPRTDGQAISSPGSLATRVIGPSMCVAAILLVVGLCLTACVGRARGRRSFDPAVDRLMADAGGDASKRAAALVARLTLEEKVDQLQNDTPAIARLGIPAYDWWSESLHGVARNGAATVFPQAIALAATFDEDLVLRVAHAIADEARAKFRESGGGRREGSGRYGGLTFFAPNVNIFRDPRWGRGQETYGEDPLLAARLGVAYVRGLQGDDPAHLRVAAVAKHFAVHSGPEVSRHRFNAQVDARDLTATYLPQFEALVREGRVSGVMAAYNRLNGTPCVANATLLGKILRDQWKFDGFVVGDCGAVDDLVSGHQFAPDGMHAAAAALRAGTDLDCGKSYRRLVDAVHAGLITEKEIDRAVTRLFAVRFRLGLFDPLPLTPALPRPPSATPDGVGGPAHLALAREAAQKSLVLLENDGVLPIGPSVRRIALVGPVADDVDVLLGNYHGDPMGPVTLLAGLHSAAAARGIAVVHAPGVSLTGRSTAGLADALTRVRDADLVIVALGLSPRIEGEENDPDGDNPAGDRVDLRLPGAQPALLAAVLETGKPTVVVMTGGSPIALPPGNRHANAVLMAWYPGEQGGHAVADVLFGAVSPSGRLPITFYRSVKDLPPFSDYRMAGRTYRYFHGRPLYPFGHGLRYSPVVCGDVTLDRAPPTPGTSDVRPVVIRAAVENRGTSPVGEVVLIYAGFQPRAPEDPLQTLVAFRRLRLEPGERQRLEVELPASAFWRVDGKGVRQPATGAWTVMVGDAPPAVVPP